MSSAKTFTAVALLGLGVGIGLFVPWTLYAYGSADAGPYRVNRLSGVQQFATAQGWATTDEIDRRGEIQTRRVEAEIAPEVAKFGSRLAQMRVAERTGGLRKVEVMGRSVSAYYVDGRKEQYFAIDVDDPRLEDVQTIAQRLSVRRSYGGATAGGGTGE